MAILEAEHGDDAVRINLAILREWLEGGGLRPVTWATFTNVMADIRQGAMAKEISEILKLTGTGYASDAYYCITTILCE